ncbi:hypothetical protein [Methanocrinis sp.]|uniref:hypothetical protein n=1 Tax=Methanocrinis sp. TaxID=3101522 RepID=UPI003D0EFFAB
MDKTENHSSIAGSNLDSTLKDAAEGYGDLMAISVVHNVSVKSLRSRLKELEMERVRERQREREIELKGDLI